jgi:hypothetical protein
MNGVQEIGGPLQQKQHTASNDRGSDDGQSDSAHRIMAVAEVVPVLRGLFHAGGFR